MKQTAASKWAFRFFGIFVVVAIVLAMTVFRSKIIVGLSPFAVDVKALPPWEGYLILGGVMFALQFPPLFGAEILMLFTGFVYGLWPAFAICDIGMLSGETALFLIARYTCTSIIERHLKSNEMYVGLTTVITEGGSFMIFLIRLSALPVHFTTFVFGFMDSLSFTTWFIAGIISSPKILTDIYLGSSYEDLSNPVETPHAKMISDIAFGVKLSVSALLAIYLYIRFAQIRKAKVEAEKSESEQVFLSQPDSEETMYLNPSQRPYVPVLHSPNVSSRPRASDEIPLTSEQKRELDWEKVEIETEK